MQGTFRKKIAKRRSLSFTSTFQALFLEIMVPLYMKQAHQEAAHSYPKAPF